MMEGDRWDGERWVSDASGTAPLQASGAAPAQPARACEVLGLTPEHLVEVATPDGPREARLAVAGKYVPHLGDRVLVVGDEAGELYLIGVLRALRPADLLAEAPDGTTVRRELDERGRARIVVRAPGGQVVAEHSNGRTVVHGTGAGVEVVAGDGPLTLASEHEVRIDGKRGVRVTSERRVVLETGRGERETRVSLDPRGAEVRAPELDVEAGAVRIAATGVLRLAADVLEATAATLRQRADSAEVDVGQLVERARETYREVEQLAQTRAGELRLVAVEAFRALAKHTMLKAREDIKLRAEKNIYLD